jgi:heme a synthase
MTHKQPKNNFLRMARLTLLLTYTVIAAGAIVRASGSGMGCPDWPKCFGQYIPPLSAEELPEKYKILHQSGEMVFNVYQTYTEYINRLMGALLGFSMFIMLIYSMGFLNQKPRVFWLSLSALLLTGFQGWLGAKVVSSNLQPVKITTHMVVALAILALLIYIIRVAKNDLKTEKPYKGWLIAVLSISIIQILVGTQVREQVDALKTIDRNLWISQLNGWFYLHRSFSVLVLTLNVLLFLSIKRQAPTGENIDSAKTVLLLLSIEISAGVMLNYLAVPAFVQPVHLLLACVIFGSQLKIAVA